MKILQAIQNIYKTLRTLAPIAGEGVNIERTPNGFIVSCVAKPSAVQRETGMFTIVDRTDGTAAKISIEDTSPAAEKDSNGVPVHAGIPHVNGVTFPSLVRFDFSPPSPNTYNIYIHFDATRIKPQEESAAGTADGTAPAVAADPPACEILAVPLQRRSTFTDLYYLIGRVRVEAIDGKPVIAAISQDHRPAPAYLTWYGPDIGVGEDTPLEDIQ